MFKSFPVPNYYYFLWKIIKLNNKGISFLIWNSISFLVSGLHAFLRTQRYPCGHRSGLLGSVRWDHLEGCCRGQPATVTTVTEAYKWWSLEWWWPVSPHWLTNWWELYSLAFSVRNVVPSCSPHSSPQHGKMNVTPMFLTQQLHILTFKESSAFSTQEFKMSSYCFVVKFWGLRCSSQQT